jgi:hypothetical protein
MTAEQRAEFHAAFRRDANGRYRMNDELVNSPSRAAALFGHLFNNDPTAVRNFLGPGGGGGRQQLLNRPEANLLASYFAMGQDAQGNAARQYDTVNGLARQTITPQAEAEIRRVREAEDIRNLQDNENRRDAALGENTSALNRMSNAIAAFAAGNPIAATVASTTGGMLAAPL